MQKLSPEEVTRRLDAGEQIAFIDARSDAAWNV